MKITILTLAAVLGTASLNAGAAEAPSRTLLLKPESRLWLEGDSTMHPYKSEASTLSARVEVSGDAAAPYAAGLRALEVVVPVAGLKSGKGGLDKNLRKHLKAAEHPDISFKMARYEVVSSTFIRVFGALAVAGVEKPAELESALSQTEGGARATGSEELLMSDFGITPPTMFMGALKTADKVVVHFDLILETDTRRQP